MNTKSWAAGAVLVAVASLPVQAIPIAFDIEGTINNRSFHDGATGEITSDPTAVGQGFFARMIVETDLLGPQQFFDQQGVRHIYSETPHSGAPPYLSIRINGADLGIPQYEQTYNFVLLQDMSGPDITAPFDFLNVSWRSDNSPRVGRYDQTNFDLFSSDFLDRDYIDLDQPFDPESLLTAELRNLSLRYQTTIYDCVEIGVCSERSSDVLSFDIASVRRSVYSTSVPEPGTLGLAMMGLLAAGFARRRAGSPSLQLGV